ncbi:Release factor glutamine methyltransferase [Vibrio stylophorae]|uniref:Release factor glutamine methyltransferase n=1 Tax=Vibrio stylophorae TaxID=659351 RepID=A0ABM8ZUL5_9VIBR|nr:peptide chain release factor N(5)-glutamine methyltransferase [Vibrio stylophorae]CAH0534017.1 Release factor glutamine methyltransferase [Vibrio stylophorae]
MAALPNLEQAQQFACAQFESESAKLDAALLLCFVLDKPRSYLFTWPDAQLSEVQWQQYQNLISRRQQGEPVAYLIGEREFWSLPLSVSPDTLIPRPDTERLVEVALELLPASAASILDLGTGTGAIALALASERRDCAVTGVDRIEGAVQLAQCNGQKLNLPQVRFVQSNWFDALAGQRFDLIVSNPPYIDDADPHLEQGDVRFEPRSALVAGDHGLSDIDWISTHAIDHLQSGGWLAFEHGYDQGLAVRQLLQQKGYCQVRTEQDYGGRDRVTLGQWQP